VAVVTDVVRTGQPVVGYGFASIGRYAQSGLIKERFAPRLLRAAAQDITTDDGANLDPFRAWTVMMTGEKPGGHGERCVAVGTLDMALRDAAAKIADLPLHRFLAGRLGRNVTASQVPVYASGGYPYPDNDIAALSGEIRHFAGLGFTHVKIKIGGASLDQDLRRIEADAAHLTGSEHLAVDALNSYGPGMSLTAATALARFGLWWFEDICDPLDFATHARIAAHYHPAIAAGEALFSAAEAALLDRYAGLRRARDVLVFDPVHCYGLPGYLQIIDTLTAVGWPRRAFWPHGGHLFSLHLVAALGLGGAEITRWPSTRSTAHRSLYQSAPVASTFQTFPELVSNSTATHGRPSDHSPRRTTDCPDRCRGVRIDGSAPRSRCPRLTYGTRFWMLHRAWEAGLSDPRDLSPLAQIERELGVRLPAEYRAGLAAEARVVVAGPREGDKIWLYPVPELSGINAAADLPDRLPGLIIIGTDGSREMLALDGRTDPLPVVLVDVVFSEWDDAIWQAPDLATFLREYPGRGLRWS